MFFLAFWYYGFFGCGKIAIENPTPSTVFEMPEPTQIIQPFEYGHNYSKRTLLWLFGVPPLVPTKFITDHKPFLPSGTGRKLGGASYGSCRRGEDAKNRAKTPEGIAAAMAEQWG